MTKRPDHSMQWVMIALVFGATVINYLDRQTLSVVAPILIDDFHMSNEAYSRVIFGFMLAYTIMNGVSGPLIDRLGTRVGYALTTAWWSVAAMLHALATGPWSLGTFRFLLGMGEAGNWPQESKSWQNGSRPKNVPLRPEFSPAAQRWVRFWPRLWLLRL